MAILYGGFGYINLYMKTIYLLLITLLAFTVQLIGQQTDPYAIIQKASDEAKQIQSIDYSIFKIHGDPSNPDATANASIQIRKDEQINHPIFDQYRFTMKIEIDQSGERQNQAFVYDGSSFKVFNRGKRTIIENPSKKEVMQNLGLNAYNMLIKAYHSPDGLDYLLNRKLSMAGYTKINDAVCYKIKVTTTNPVTYKEMTSYWSFDMNTYKLLGFENENERWFISTATENEAFKSNLVEETVSANPSKYVEQKVEIKEGDEFPITEFTLFNGSQFNFPTANNKWLLLDFWGTWCAPCLRAMPQIEQIHQELGDKIKVIGISVKDEAQKAKNYMTKKGYSYDLVSPGDEISEKLGIHIFPTVVLVSPDKKIIKVLKGFEDDLVEKIQSVVK
jgi:thiol-disulfide isomerase/thioredoxin